MPRLRSAPLAAAFVLVAAATSASTLRVGLTAPMTNADPAAVRDIASIKIHGAVYEPLVVATGSGTRLEAGLATSWTPAARFAEWTLRIRPGVVFSDGTPLTAKIAADSLRKVAEIAARGEITADDAAGTLTFRLKAPDAELPILLTQSFAMIVLRKDGKVVGTGPFRFAPDSTNAAPHLVRNEKYREAVPTDELRFVVFSAKEGGAEALREALVSDRVDLTDMLPPWTVKRLDKVSHLEVRSSASRSLAMLVFNLKSGPGSDVRVRRAFAHAIDRERLAKVFTPGEPAPRSPLPPSLGTLPKDPYDHDPAKAKALFAEAKLPKGWKPTIHDTGPPGAPKVGIPRLFDELARDFAAVGLECEVKVHSSLGDALAVYAAGKFDLGVARWIADGPSIADYLSSNLASTQRGTCPSCNNVTGWSNPEADRLLAEYRATRSEAALTKLGALFNAELPFIPLITGKHIAVWNKRVTGYAPTPAPTIDYRKIAVK